MVGRLPSHSGGLWQKGCWGLADRLSLCLRNGKLVSWVRMISGDNNDRNGKVGPQVPGSFPLPRCGCGLGKGRESKRDNTYGKRTGLGSPCQTITEPAWRVGWRVRSTHRHGQWSASSCWAVGMVPRGMDRLRRK